MFKDDERRDEIGNGAKFARLLSKEFRWKTRESREDTSIGVTETAA